MGAALVKVRWSKSAGQSPAGQTGRVLSGFAVRVSGMTTQPAGSADAMTTRPGSTDSTTTPALSGKVALVAGATRGAGRQIAVQLGAAGATVYATGRST